MRRLTDRVELGSDRGVSAILVALCAVVLFGIAAWVIDGSALYQERRELQRGADAAALAVAEDCATDVSCTGPDGAPVATALAYINPNATDGRTDLQPSGVTIDHGAQTVRVAVETLDEAGGGLDGDESTVDYVFGPVLGKDGLQVLAEATAAWGTAGGGSTIPLIISECEWDWATTGGTDYAEEPFHPADEVILYFHVGGGGGGAGGGGAGGGGAGGGGAGGGGGGGGGAPGADCDAHPGHDYDGDTRLPGGFGWLQDDDCVAEVSPDLWVGSEPGAAAPQGCDPDELINSTVLIPVFNDVTETGNPGGCTYGPGGKCYRVLGFAAFHITGFRFPGGPDWRQPHPPPCNGSEHCISGYFVEFVFGGATGGGGTDLGASAVWLVS